MLSNCVVSIPMQNPKPYFFLLSSDILAEICFNMRTGPYTSRYTTEFEIDVLFPVDIILEKHIDFDQS